MKVSSTKRKMLDSKTGQSFLLNDKSMQRQQQNTRKPTNKQMSRQERDETLEKLEKDILEAQYDISDYIQKYNKWSSNPTIIRNQTDVATYLFCKKLDIACREPLARGIDSRSIAESIGMSIGMRLASKDYREYKKAQRAEKKIESREKWASRAEKIAEFGIPYAVVTEKGEIIEGKMNIPGAKALKSFADWNKERTLKKAHGGILPITQEGAAMTYIGLAKSAYQDMREPGADVDAIYGKFKTAIDCLYEQAKYQGVDAEVINKQIREVVGKLAENHPDMSIFEQMSNDDIEFKDGKFMNTKNGTEYTGEFKPRKPKTMEEYKEIIQDGYAKMYSKCDNVNEINEIDFQKNGFAEKMDRLRTQFCSDFGQNMEDVTEINEKFNQIYSSAAVVKLHDWAEGNEQRQRELDALFKHIQQEYTAKETEQTTNYRNYTPASEMISPELLEVAGMNNYNDMSYGMER